jgi:cytochrome c biogenesis protein CcmG/thiol:disulfide interchange protein DsbE
MITASSEGSSRRRRNVLVFLPLLAFAALAALFFYRLSAGDPSRLPSALIGHPMPSTDLPPLPGLERDGKPVPGLTNATFEGAVTLVNVWASWCVPCHDEVPFLEQLSKDKRIQLVGINYKDAPDNARRFLNRYGNPFVATGRDEAGRASIDWGVYGVPETFLGRPRRPHRIQAHRTDHGG